MLETERLRQFCESRAYSDYFTCHTDAAGNAVAVCKLCGHTYSSDKLASLSTLTSHKNRCRKRHNHLHGLKTVGIKSSSPSLPPHNLIDSVLAAGIPSLPPMSPSTVATGTQVTVPPPDQPLSTPVPVRGRELIYDMYHDSYGDEHRLQASTDFELLLLPQIHQSHIPLVRELTHYYRSGTQDLLLLEHFRHPDTRPKSVLAWWCATLGRYAPVVDIVRLVLQQEGAPDAPPPPPPVAQGDLGALLLAEPTVVKVEVSGTDGMGAHSLGSPLSPLAHMSSSALVQAPVDAPPPVAPAPSVPMQNDQLC
jgi:hypothetical protein